MKRTHASGLGFGLALTLLSAIGILGFNNSIAVSRTFTEVEHVHSVLSLIDDLSETLRNAESARRAYAGSGERAQGAQTIELLGRTEGIVAALDRLTAEDAHERANIERLLPMIRTRDAALRGAVAARERGANPAIEAELSAANDAGITQAGAIFRLMSSMTQEAHQLLAVRAAEARAGSDRTLAAVVTGTILAFVLLLAAFAVLRREIAVRVRTEAGLRRWGTIFEHADWGVSTCTPDGRTIELANPAFAALHGASGARLEGTELSALVPREGHDELARAIERARSQGHFSFETIRERDGGAKFPVAIELSTIKAPNGSDAELVVRVQDISARKEAQTERDKFFDLSLDLILILDKGTFKKTSPSVERVLGFADSELVGKSYLDLVHPDDVAATLETSARGSDGTPISGFECRFRCKDGSYRSIEWTSVRDLPGRLSYSIGRDTTESRKTRDQIAGLNVELAERVRAVTAANEELEAFSYSVSHDLRAPLRSIDGFSQALLEDLGPTLDPDAKDHLNRVRGATQRMGHLIDDLINLSRITRQTFTRAPVDVSALARSVAAELQSAEPARHVEIVVADDMIVLGDAKLLRIALDNLLRNAWKFTGKRPHARIEVGTRTEPSGKTSFFVKDDGAGFDMAHAKRLFGAFQRLHTVVEFPGTGIGLATVARIIHRHGGEIWADAAVDQGATFFMTLNPLLGEK